MLMHRAAFGALAVSRSRQIAPLNESHQSELSFRRSYESGQPVRREFDSLDSHFSMVSAIQRSLTISCD